MTDKTGGSAVHTPTGGARNSTRTVVICVAVVSMVSVLSVVLRQRVPITVGLSYYDDLLFLRSAGTLINHDWLGPFDNRTLAKGPSYPAFIAVMHWIGLPLKIGEQLTYLLACAGVAGCIRLISGRLVLATVAFSFLALDPLNYNSPSAELVRDNWYASLGLLFPAAVFLALAMALRRVRIIWVLLTAVLAGFAGAAYWLCREEGASILPTIAIVVIGLPLLSVAAWRRLPSAQRWRGRARAAMLRFGAALVLITLGLVVPTLVVDNKNETLYGAALSNDMGAGEFVQVYADWTRVNGGSGVLRVPLSYQQRLSLYAVSPAAQEIEPFLEQTPSYWNQTSCGRATECDYSGAFMVWALRDAAAQAGHFGTEADAQAYFQRLDDEIRAGCDSGSLQCSAGLPAALQPILRAPPGQLLSTLSAMVGRLVISDAIFDQPAQYWPDPLGTRAATAPIIAGLPADDATAAAEFAAFDQSRWPYQILSPIYRVGLVVLCVLALLAVTGGWWFIGRSRPLLILAIAVGVNFLTRSFLLALIDTVEYDTTALRYQLPSHVVLVGFAVLGSAALFDEVRSRQTGRGHTTIADQPRSSVHDLPTGQLPRS